MEKKINIIDGIVIYDNQEFCFNYSDNIITLYPKELEVRWESMKNMFMNFNIQDTKNTINLYGKTINENLFLSESFPNNTYAANFRKNTNNYI